MMEKLIELLNEYEKEKNPKTEYKWFSSYYKPLCYGFKVPFQGWHDNGEDYSEEIATSKQYGFIKWLVENDKIEGETIGNYQSRTKLRTLTHTAGLWHDAEGKSELEYIKETFTDGLLMLLSISDTPIEDLISYLR